MSTRTSKSKSKTSYRLAVLLTIGTALLLTWLSLGVGIIGRDGDPANRMYAGVLALGIVGAAIARLHAAGMAVTLFGMALAQALVTAIALMARWGLPYSGPVEIVLLNGFFVGLFMLSAMMFRRAAQMSADQAAAEVRDAHAGTAD